MKPAIISVVVPHYNNLAKLEKCLAALYLSAPATTALEIIVVDNASTVDLSALQRQYLQVVWLSETSRQSPYPTRNKGIRHARGEVIVLLDSNCLPLKHFFHPQTIALLNEYDLCGGQLKLTHSGSLTSRFDVLYSALRPSTEAVTSLPGGVLFCKRAVFEKTGLFLPCVRSLGDIEWTYRAYLQGLKLGITPQPVVRYSTKEWKAFGKKMIRLGCGKKEIYVNQGGNLRALSWWGSVFKNLLPPHPRFVSRMNTINRQENTELSLFSIICFCWLTKLLRGYGMLFGKVAPPCPPPPWREG